MREHVLLISLSDKTLIHYKACQRVASYPISTSRNPPSCRENSFGTPLGLHQIAAHIGEGAAPGTVFISRESTGQTYSERADAGPNQKMYVTTRILRLRGLEPDRNAEAGQDTFDRYVYIHGTPHPQRFPENMSGGCIILLDHDLIELFNTVPDEALLWIQEAPFIPALPTQQPDSAITADILT